MLDFRLYIAQRITAMIMAPLVLGHLAVMIYAVQGGLNAAEILGRTRGSLVWFLFYGTFVMTVAVHGAIGLRSIAHEWGGVRGVALEAVMWGTGVILLTMGGRAVWSVTFA